MSVETDAVSTDTFALPALVVPDVIAPPAARSGGRRITVLQDQLLADGARCWECPLGRGSYPGRPVPTTWDHRKGQPKLALVGEAPGLREAQRGAIFIGPSGKLLDTACRASGVPRGELAILNSVACGPIPSGAEDLKRRALEACRPRLLTELRRLRPDAILGIGGLALRTLAPHAPSGITALRGALLEPGTDVSAPGWSPLFLATLHPAYILRGGDGEGPDAPGGEGARAVDLQFYFLVYDLGKAWRLATGLAKPWADACDLFLVHNGKLRRATTDAMGKPIVGDLAAPDELVEAMRLIEREARGSGAYSCDVETDAKDSLDANLTAISFATVEGGMSATWAAFKMVPEALARAKAILAAKLDKWFWNRMYDCVVLPRHGLPVGHSIHDGMLLHHAAFPGLPHKLDAVAQQFLCVSAWKTEFRRSSKNEAELVIYNYRDSAATILIPEPLLVVSRSHHTERVYEADRQIAGIAQNMREFGFWVDRVEQARQSKVQHARLQYMKASLERDFAVLEEPWRDRLARNLAVLQRKKDPENFMERVALRYKQIAKRKRRPTDVGLLKTKAKADLVALFEVLRIPFMGYTAKGSPVTDKKAMEAAAAKHPLMRQLIHMREAQHVIATYIDGLPIKRTGRVHPDWSTTKISGRWGAGKSQNIPKQVSGWPPEEEVDPNWLPPLDGGFEAPPDPALWAAVPAAVDESENLPLPIPVNLKDCPEGWQHDPSFVYCGRAGLGFDGAYGNPHTIGGKGGLCVSCGAKHRRADAIELFRVEATARFATDAAYRAFVEQLRGKKCVCFCAPKPCHCAVYVELLAPPVVKVPAAPVAHPRPGFRWKRKPSGDYVTAPENCRAIITAPTVDEILAHALEAPDVYQDARYSQIFDRALAGVGRRQVGADMNQLELRIAALLGKDPFLLNAYGTGADVHAMNARVCFPKVFPKLETDFKAIAETTPYGYAKPLTLKADLSRLTQLDDVTRGRLLKLQKPWSKLRDLAKRLVYAWIYRGLATTAYQSLVKEFPELELAAVSEAFKLLDQKIVGWVTWCNRNEISVRQNREVRESLLGRVRLFPLGNYDINIAVNFPVQAFGATLIIYSLFRYYALVKPEILELEKLYALGLLDRAWVEARRAEGYDRWAGPAVPTINGHDAITVECDDEDAQSVCPKCGQGGFGMKCAGCDATLPPSRMSVFLEACMDFTITIDGASMHFFGEAAVGRRLSET